MGTLANISQSDLITILVVLVIIAVVVWLVSHFR